MCVEGSRSRNGREHYREKYRDRASPQNVAGVFHSESCVARRRSDSRTDPLRLNTILAISSAPTEQSPE